MISLANALIFNARFALLLQALEGATVREQAQSDKMQAFKCCAREQLTMLQQKLGPVQQVRPIGHCNGDCDAWSARPFERPCVYM